MSSIGRLGKNAILVFIGNMGSKLISLIMLPIYTRWLSVEDYGLTDIISVYVTLLMGVVTCCIADALFVFPKGANTEDKKKYFSSSVFFEIIMLLITYLIFFFIQKCTKENTSSFVDNIWLIYLMLCSQIIQQTIQQFVRSIDKMLLYSLTGIISTVTVALYSIILIPRFGVIGYVFAIILSNVSASIFSFIIAKIYTFVSIVSINLCYLKKMLQYSVPLIPNGIMWWLVNAVNRPIMENSVGLYGNGIYAVANKLPGVLTMLFSVFVTAWQISVLEEFGKKEYKKFYNKIFEFLFVLMITAMMIITMLSKELISLFADQSYYEAWKFVPALTLSVFFSSIAGFVGVNFSAARQSKYYFYSSIYAAVVAVVLNSTLIPRYGLWGAVVSLNGSFAIMAISRIMYSWKYVSIDKIYVYLLYLLYALIFGYVYMMELPSYINMILFGIFIIYILISKRKLIINLIKNYNNDR